MEYRINFQIRKFALSQKSIIMIRDDDLFRTLVNPSGEAKFRVLREFNTNLHENLNQV